MVPGSDASSPCQAMGKGIATRPPPTSLPPTIPLHSVFSPFFNLLLVLPQVFCTPFFHYGANPTQNRPLVVMLLFSDVSECAPDSRGRSHVGHTLMPEFVFLSSTLPFIMPFQIRGFVWSGFIFKEGPRVHVVFFICARDALYLPINKGVME